MYKFRLSDHLRKVFKDESIFTAEDMGDSVKVSYTEDNGEYASVIYDAKEVQQYINNGDWVIIHE
jgi:hypothetical protein